MTAPFFGTDHPRLVDPDACVDIAYGAARTHASVHATSGR
jgi:hypothetical protein